jgi:hypothetical protein
MSSALRGPGLAQRNQRCTLAGYGAAPEGTPETT